MSDRTREIAKYILYKKHCHPEDGEYFYNSVVESIEKALDSEARYWIERCAEIALKLSTENEVSRDKAERAGRKFVAEFRQSDSETCLELRKRFLALLKETGEKNDRP